MRGVRGVLHEGAREFELSGLRFKSIETSLSKAIPTL